MLRNSQVYFSSACNPSDLEMRPKITDPRPICDWDSSPDFLQSSASPLSASYRPCYKGPLNYPPLPHFPYITYIENGYERFTVGAGGGRRGVNWDPLMQRGVRLSDSQGQESHSGWVSRISQPSRDEKNSLRKKKSDKKNVEFKPKKNYSHCYPCNITHFRGFFVQDSCSYSSQNS